MKKPILSKAQIADKYDLNKYTAKDEIDLLYELQFEEKKPDIITIIDSQEISLNN